VEIQQLTSVIAKVNFWLIALAQLPVALALAVVYHQWDGITSFVSGAKAGAFITTLFGLSSNLMMMAQMNLIDWWVLGTNVIGYIAWGGIGGGLIAWILNRKE